MILNLIQSYIKSKEVTLNGYLGSAIQLKQIQTELDLGLIGASESFINYQLYVSGIDKSNSESQRVLSVNTRLEFIFLAANKDYKVYKKIFDRYVFGIFRVLSDKTNVSYKDETISGLLKINNLTDLKITNADNFDNEYYRPSIEFNLQIIDKTTLSDFTTILNSETV
jgi:hypothetical protein